ncbi:methyltransferase-like protein 17, mitochondrial isoform X1 [Mustela nigripes]|uniref:Ribosome assembly protein METTL17, mitochondrial n=1 Tax=Mustela putorius furo TaxID=9669 RepID=A0A8U0RFY9_MUSPF|nr:methyltransferase-like protein 17, mitochondrial isoform X2 [Mustela putorius furo]XP_059243230.1 methyltransferase-like protein 17, mitochondrial isoform X1 [Mustela nigripes]
MATVRGLRHLLSCSRWRRGSGEAPQSRTLAAVVPGISQVDNNSDFLGKTPHRRHPGILQLPCIKVPPALAAAAQFLLLESPMPNVEKQVQALTNYLWSRRLPVEPQELQRRAVHLEKKFLENPDLGQVEEKLREAVLRALRKTTYHWQELSYNESLSLVYMAARLDGGFAAVSRAFHEIQARVPEFQPQTLMDFGSGTGSVTWAAHSAWGQSLREYLCVDSSAAMLVLAEKLLKGGSESGEPYVPGVFFRQFLPVSPKVQFDVVVSAFSLSELPSKADRTELVQTLWRKTSHFLVLVENGTKAGHCLLMDARDLVLKGKEKSPLDPRPGFVFAPNKKKQKEEKFSMVILARGSPEEANRWPRITQPVLKRPRHVHCHLCCPDGHMQHAVITARQHGRDLYRCARVSSWGDLLPVITPSESELPLSPADDKDFLT